MSTSEQARADHACDACRGSGYEYRDMREYGHAYRIRRAVRFLCPVCLGTRRISDLMPARDAVADAETLRACGLLANGLFGLGTGAAILRLKAQSPVEWDVQYFVVPAQVSLNARAAFRAVPGLRGDR